MEMGMTAKAEFNDAEENGDFHLLKRKKITHIDIERKHDNESINSAHK